MRAMAEDQSFDDAKIEQGVRLILEGIGEDPDREGCATRPARVARHVRGDLRRASAQDPAEHSCTVVEGADSTR